MILVGFLTMATAIPGADPTGGADSSAALNAYIRKLCDSGPQPPKMQCRLDARPVERVLDLNSGVYRLDAPLRFDKTVSCSGPVRVRSGTLLAGSGIGNSSFLVEAQDYIGQRKVGFALSFEHVVFASNYTGGGLKLNRSSFVTVSDCNFINFKTYGIWTTGADFRLDRSVLMECTNGMTHCEDPLVATAMYIDGADSHFNRNVVACTGVGFVNANGDNFYHGNHIWTNCHPPQTDHGVGDNNTVGWLISGGSPQLDGNAIDNCHLRIESYRGVVLTNNHFNSASRLVLAPPNTGTPKAADPTDVRCQYWRGAMCSLRVAGNTFTCGSGLPNACGHIVVDAWTPLSAKQVQVTGNTWENASWSTCSAMGGTCAGEDQCSRLFKVCDSDDNGGGGALDLALQLERVASMHAAGLLDATEFSAAKRRILGL